MFLHINLAGDESLDHRVQITRLARWRGAIRNSINQKASTRTPSFQAFQQKRVSHILELNLVTVATTSLLRELGPALPHQV